MASNIHDYTPQTTSVDDNEAYSTNTLEAAMTSSTQS